MTTVDSIGCVALLALQHCTLACSADRADVSLHHRQRVRHCCQLRMAQTRAALKRECVCACVRARARVIVYSAQSLRCVSVRLTYSATGTDGALCGPQWCRRIQFAAERSASVHRRARRSTNRVSDECSTTAPADLSGADLHCSESVRICLTACQSVT